MTLIDRAVLAGGGAAEPAMLIVAEASVPSVAPPVAFDRVTVRLRVPLKAGVALTGIWNDLELESFAVQLTVPLVAV